jgi:hypothetical protein
VLGLEHNRVMATHGNCRHGQRHPSFIVHIAYGQILERVVECLPKGSISKPEQSAIRSYHSAPEIRDDAKGLERKDAGPTVAIQLMNLME